MATCLLAVCCQASSAVDAPAVLAKPLGVGIVGNCCTHGAGLCAMFKAREDTRVVAACESDTRRAEELSQVLGAPLATSWDAVIGHPDVVIVAVATDPCDKAAVVERAAAAGKHIFLNKPFADSLDNARRIEAAVKRHGVWLVHDIPMVRSEPVYARLLEEVRAGKHGAVLGYYHRFGMNFAPDFDLKGLWPERLDPPELSGGGEMTNMGCYAIDYAVALFGRPRAVTAKCRKTWDVYREADVENYGQIVLDYGDFFAYLDVGKQQLEGERRNSNAVTINFEHETLHLDPPAHLVAVNNVARDYAEFIGDASTVSSADQLIQAIVKGVAPSSDAASGVLATETLMAAYRSIVEKRPVELPLPSGENPLVREPGAKQR